MHCFALCFFLLQCRLRLLLPFRNTVRSLKGRNLNNNGHIGRSNGAVVATREASQFMDIARLVPFFISNTCLNTFNAGALVKTSHQPTPSWRSWHCWQRGKPSSMTSRSRSRSSPTSSSKTLPISTSRSDSYRPLQSMLWLLQTNWLPYFQFCQGPEKGPG